MPPTKTGQETLYLCRYLLQDLLLHFWPIWDLNRCFFIEPIFAETAQYPRSFVALFVQGRRPEGFRAQLVGKAIYRRTELISQTPELVESRLAPGLCLLPHFRCLSTQLSRKRTSADGSGAKESELAGIPGGYQGGLGRRFSFAAVVKDGI
jgi:hypothetical protein